jgi:hypothetical protein
MKLKRFTEFVNEAALNESTVNVEESVFLINGTAYFIGTIEYEASWIYEEPDTSVGFYGGHSIENYEVNSIDRVEKFASSELNQEFIELATGSSDLVNLGLGEFDLWKYINSNKMVEVTEEAELDQVLAGVKDITESLMNPRKQKSQTIDLTGDYQKRIDLAIDREEYDPS